MRGGRSRSCRGTARRTGRGSPTGANIARQPSRSSLCPWSEMPVMRPVPLSIDEHGLIVLELDARAARRTLRAQEPLFLAGEQDEPDGARGMDARRLENARGFEHRHRPSTVVGRASRPGPTNRGAPRRSTTSSGLVVPRSSATVFARRRCRRPGCWRCRPAASTFWPSASRRWNSVNVSCGTTTMASGNSDAGDPLIVSSPNSFAPSLMRPSAPSLREPDGERLPILDADPATQSAMAKPAQRSRRVTVSAAVMGGPSGFHTKAGGRVMTHFPLTAVANRAAYSAGVTRVHVDHVAGLRSVGPRRPRPRSAEELARVGARGPA